jgi:hypothetical protein
VVESEEEIREVKSIAVIVSSLEIEGRQQARRRVDSRTLTEREALSLALLFDRSALLDTRLLLLQFGSLTLKLIFHLPMTSKELFLALLQLALFLLDLLLEDHLHLGLHLRELLLVQGPLFFLLDGRVHLLKDAGILRNTHLDELVGTIVLVERIVSVLLEFFHVRSDEHLSELDKVAVVFIVHFDDTPGITATANFASFGVRNLVIGTNDSERHLGHDFLVLGDCLFIVQLITRAFEDLDGVVLDVGENLCMLVRILRVFVEHAHALLECSDLFIGQSIGLGDDGDQVDLGVQTAHDLDV